MQSQNTRRKRKRRPTMNPRFGPSSIALELGLLRMTMDIYREQEKKESKDQEK